IALVERGIAAVVADALTGIGRAPASAGARRLAPLRARPALGVSVGEQQSHYCDTEQNKTDRAHGSFSQSVFSCGQCKRRGGVAAEHAHELAPLLLDDPKAKDHADYSRSKPCIAAKAGRLSPVWVKSDRSPRRREQGSNPGEHAIVRYLASASAAPNAARFFLVSSSFDASLALASISRIVGRSAGKMPTAQVSLVSRMAALKSRALAGFIPWATVTRAPSIVSALPARALVKPSKRTGVRCAGCSNNRNEAWMTRAEMR